MKLRILALPVMVVTGRLLAADATFDSLYLNQKLEVNNSANPSYVKFWGGTEPNASFEASGAYGFFYLSKKSALILGTSNGASVPGIYTLSVGDSIYPLGRSSVAVGYYSQTALTAPNSIAVGYYAYTAGQNSAAFGEFCSATGYASAAFGSGISSGDYSFSANGGYASNYRAAAFNAGIAVGAESAAFGSASASGTGSAAFGSVATAAAAYSVAVGRYNTTVNKDGGAVNATSWVDLDPLFSVGNGTSPSAKRDALVVYKGGDIRMAKRQGDIPMGKFGKPGSGD